MLLTPRYLQRDSTFASTVEVFVCIAVLFFAVKPDRITTPRDDLLQVENSINEEVAGL